MVVVHVFENFPGEALLMFGRRVLVDVTADLSCEGEGVLAGWF